MPRQDSTQAISKVVNLGNSTGALPAANASATTGFLLVGVKADGTRMNKKFPNEGVMRIWMASNDAAGYEFSNAVAVPWP